MSDDRNRAAGDGDVRGLVERLSRRIGELEQLVARAPSPARERDDESVGEAVRDAMWKCRKCASLLAFYDSEEDVLRIRYKDHLTYVKVGEGGWVQVVCRGCGEPNLQGYASADEIAETQRDAVAGLKTRRQSRPGGGAGVAG